MNDARFIVVVTTVGTRAEARAMARTLVERQLAACAQISEIESFYAWDGEIRDEPEFRIWLKTVRERYDEVEAAIRGLHPYELPAIYALPVGHIFAPYGDWVEAAGG
ncbi:MAG TPA: divalent-cation tolerance protein CutA [Caldimonas sp.]|jgi:periplasmic divalent cation tolerance protein|nr:divalent-cation tolerance protein CutA [Caldimonas sp.]HEX2540071.1 divalent-cation tolerance protein CutA [Caldimonas sp.]